MRRRRGVPAPVLGLSLLALGLLLAGCPGGEEAPAPDEAPDETQPPIVQDVTAADLYFPAYNGFLGVERRQMDLTGTPEEQIRLLVETLLTGPEQPEHGRAFAEGVTLAEVYVAENGTAYVDLASPEAQEPPSTGSLHEMQIVYSLVDTVALNVPGVERVALLWNGRQRLTFAGHLDTSVPLAPQTELVSR